MVSAACISFSTSSVQMVSLLAAAVAATVVVAAVVPIVVAATAAAIVVAAAAEQDEDQDDDPPAVVTAEIKKTIVTHNGIPPFSFRNAFHRVSIPWYSTVQKMCGK